MRRILLAILLGVSVGVLLLEAGLRLFSTGRVVALPNRHYLLSRMLNCEGTWISPEGEFKQVIRFNSLRLRGSEPALTRPHRFLVLGDSMVEALQVREEETFCYRLEEGLGSECTVVNGGMGGYSPLLMSLRLPELLEQIHPQLVLVGIFPNDLEEEYRYWTLASSTGTGFPYAVTSPVLNSRLGRLDCFLFRNSMLWRCLHQQVPLARPDGVITQQGEPPESVIYPFRTRWTRLEEEAWAEMSRSLGEMERLCRQSSAKMQLLLIPPGNQVSPEAWKTGKKIMGYGPDDWVQGTTFQDEVTTRARRIGIPVTDLLASFRAYPDPKVLYFDRDGHWTEKGHWLASEVLLSATAGIDWGAH